MSAATHRQAARPCGPASGGGLPCNLWDCYGKDDAGGRQTGRAFFGRTVSVPPRFAKAVKRLHGNQKRELDEAVRAVAANPDLGDRKTGDLAWLRVYMFRMVSQLTLLAYEHAADANGIILRGGGSHENFYRDLKRD